MIIILPAKAFIKNAKKLVDPKDYFIFDATDDSDAKLMKYTNVISVDSLAPPSKLLEAKKKEDVLDERKLEKLEENFLKGANFEAAIIAVLKSYLEYNGKVNIFIVLSKAGYKYYAKKIAKKICKMHDIDFNFVYLWKDIEEDFKSVIKKSLSDRKIQHLLDTHKSIIQRLNKSKKKKKKKKD